MLVVQLVLESTKGAFALDGPCQSAPGAFIGDGFGEVGHILVPNPGWQWMDAYQVFQFVEVDRCLAVDAGVGLDHPGKSGGLQTWKDEGLCQHRGNIPLSCGNVP